MAAGLWLANAGFGAFDTPFDYAPLMQAARRLGMITTMHTGGSSIPGSSGIWAEHVLASNRQRLVSRQWRPDRDAQGRLRAPRQ